ncbi:MAG: TolC family protein [Fibrobacteres bacterium]|nr:TolC family protein [Fibrobacterota bacterium]
MQKRKLISSAVLIVSTLTFSITERDVVQRAVKNSPDAKILSVTLTADSLAYKRADAVRSLSLTAEGDVMFNPSTDVNIGAAADSTLTNSAVQYSLTAGKLLPGGGLISASLNNGMQKNNDDDAINSGALKVAVKQPLLKGGWGKGDADVNIKVAANNLTLNRLKFRNGMLETVSNSRSAFWDWVLAVKASDIAKSEKAYADSLKSAAVTRFRVGAGTETDTLSAAIEVLRAYEKTLAAKHRERQAKENLAFLIGANADELTSPESEGDVPHIIEQSQALDSMKLTNYSLAALTTAARNVTMYTENSSNSILPAVDLSLGYSKQFAGKAPFGDNLAALTNPLKSGPFAGLSLTWDILARADRIDNKINQTKINSTAAEKEKAEKELVFRLKQLYDAWNLDSLSLSIRDAEIVIAEKAYSQMQESYKLGAAGSLELERAKNNLINARLNRLSSEIALRKAVIVIEQVAGVALNRFGVLIP